MCPESVWQGGMPFCRSVHMTSEKAHRRRLVRIAEVRLRRLKSAIRALLSVMIVGSLGPRQIFEASDHKPPPAQHNAV